MAAKPADSVSNKLPPIGYDKKELLRGNFVPANEEPASLHKHTISANKKPMSLSEQATPANKEQGDQVQPTAGDPFRY